MVAVGRARLISLILGLPLLGLPRVAWGVVTRHDVRESAYRHAAQRKAFQAVGKLYAENALLGTGTLICDRWVLTAAHVVHRSEAGAWRFDLGGARHDVEAIFVNPGWTGDPDGGHDLALLRLREPITRIGSAQMFRDTDHLGTRVTLVGYGYTGDGLVGVRTFDGALRAATNRLEEYVGDSMLFFFDEPGSHYATPREGVAAFNDSGGPVFVATDEGWRIAGTHSFIRDWNENGIIADYGDVQGACRVTLHLEWIDGILATCTGDLDASGDVGLPDLLRVLSAWGGGRVGDEDIDASGRVDVADLVRILSSWGPCP